MRRFWKVALASVVLLGASPPYNLDITHPGDTDIESVFPANERTFRDNLNSYINTEHDITTGFHKFQELTTTQKNALVTPPTGMQVYDTTLGVLQINTGPPGGPIWTTIGPSPAPAITSVGIADAANGCLNVVGSPLVASGTITLNLKPSDCLTKTTPLGTDSLLLMDVAGGNAPKTALIPAVLATGPSKGALTAGTQAVQSPVASSTVTTQAHGLGQKPDVVYWWLENLTAECGYSVGDRITYPVETSGGVPLTQVESDATNVLIITGTAQNFVLNKSTAANCASTPANWKVVAQPYKIN